MKHAAITATAASIPMALLSTSFAHADGMTTDPMPPVTPTRTGEAFAGISLAGIQADYAKNCSPEQPAFAQFCAFDKNSGGTAFGIGGRAGYNWYFNSLMLGIVGDAEHYWGRDSGVKYLASLRGRIGARITEEGVLYASGGVALGGFEDNMQLNTYYSSSSFDEVSDSKGGWVVGAGYEHHLTDRVSIYGEFNYFEFDDVAKVSFMDQETGTRDVNISQIKFGVNYNF